MKLVILESPYAGDTEKNLAYAHRCVADCLRRGESPYASHIMLTTALDDANPEQRSQGIQAGLEWADRAASVVFYCDLGISPGMIYALKEHLAARRVVDFRYLDQKPEESGKEIFVNVVSNIPDTHIEIWPAMDLTGVKSKNEILAENKRLQDSFVNLDLWRDLRADILQPRYCSKFHAAISFSKTFAALIIVGEYEGQLYPYPFFWTTTEKISNNSEIERMPYQYWIEQGHIRPMYGEFIDRDQLIFAVANVCAHFQKMTGHTINIACDRWKSIGLRDAMTSLKFGLERNLAIIDHPQGMAGMTVPIQKTIKRISEKTIFHDGNPVIDASLMEAVYHEDFHGNCKLRKRGNNSNINAALALVMAVGQAE